MTPTIYKWTVQRYHQAIEASLFDDRPLELLRGNLMAMPPEREPHAYFNSEVGDRLRDLLGDRAKVREAHPIALAPDSEPVPDLAIVRPLGRTYLERHPAPEDVYWLVEFANTSLAKDLNDKKLLYAEAGIVEYWVADLKNQQLHIFREPRDGDYATASILASGTISPLTFPDISLQVSRLISV